MKLPSVKVYCFAFTMLCTFNQFSNEALAYNLSDAISATKVSNPALMGYDEQLAITELNKPKALLQFLPNAAFNRQNTTTNYNHPTAVMPTDTSSSDTLQVQQEIFSGGRTIANLHKTNKEVEAFKARYQDAYNKLILKVIEVYQGVIANRKIYEFHTQTEKNMIRNLDQTKIRFKAGELTKTNLSEAKASLAGATANKEKAFGELKIAEAAFANIVGEMPQDHLDEFDLKSLSLPSSVDELIEISKQNNVGIVGAKSSLQAAKHSSYAAVGAMLPTVTLSASRSNTENDIPALSSPSGNSTSVSVNFKVPIFQQGVEYVEIRQANKAVKQKEYELESVQNDTVQQSVDGWNKYHAAKSALVFEGERLQFAKEVLEGVREEYNVGSKTTRDLIEAENNYLNSRVNFIRSEMQLFINAFAIHMLTNNINNINFESLSISHKDVPPAV